MKKILLFILILINNVYAENLIKPIVQVNDSIITNIDIQNEIMFIKTVYQINTDSDEMLNFAINNLIDETLKISIIKESNILIDNILLNQEYNSYISKIKKEININDKIKKIIFEKVKLEMQWNRLILKKYSWKVSINMNEIEKILKNDKNYNSDFEIFNKKKENLIINEKNKKLKVYSETYLKELKNKALIKYIK